MFAISPCLCCVPPASTSPVTCNHWNPSSVMYWLRFWYASFNLSAYCIFLRSADALMPSSTISRHRRSSIWSSCSSVNHACMAYVEKNLIRIPIWKPWTAPDYDTHWSALLTLSMSFTNESATLCFLLFLLLSIAANAPAHSQWASHMCISLNQNCTIHKR